MTTEMHTDRNLHKKKKSVVSFLLVPLFFIIFFGAFAPTTALAASVTDIANSVNLLPPATRTALCSADPTDCAFFLSNPSLTTFANLNAPTISAILNNASVSLLVPTLDANILPSLSSSVLNSTLSLLTPSVLASFSSTAFSLLPTSTISSILGNVSPSVLASLGGDLLANLSTGSFTTVLSGLAPSILQNLPGELFSTLPTGTISGLITDLTSVSPTTLSSLTNLLTGLSSGNLTSVLNGLASSVISSLPGTLFSGIVPGTLSAALNNLSGSALSSISTTLLSGITDLNLTTILNGLTGSALSSLTGSLLGLSSGTLTNVLSGLLPSLAPFLPSTLFSVLSGVTLDGVLSGVLGTGATAVLGNLGTGLFSPLSSPVLSAISNPVLSALSPAVQSTISTALGSVVPGIGFGIFVPVYDVALNPAFATYASAFNSHAANMDRILKSNPDSLRNIITGASLNEDTVGECSRGDALNKAYAWSDSSWAAAFEATSGQIPASVPLGAVSPGFPGPYVQVITSQSIRCILNDLVGYQKVLLFVQIQSLLKQYIADAQQQQLSYQLLNQINGANLNWAKQGNQVDSGGILTTTPVYDRNPTQLGYDENARTLDTMVAQVAAAPGDPIGSLGIPASWRLNIASQLAINGRNDIEDPSNSFAEGTKSTLTDPSGPFPGASGDGTEAFDCYMRDANCPQGLGAVATFASMLNNPQNSPLGLSTMTQFEKNRRDAVAKERRDKEAANSGFLPTKRCSGLESDPYCDPANMINDTTGAGNQQTVNSAIQSGNDQIINGNFLDTTSATAAEELSVTANQGLGGVAAYDTTRLQSSRTGVNELIQELYNTMGTAYFDVTEDRRNWAQAALLSIYDEMYFDDLSPNIVLPNASAPGWGPTTEEWLDYY